MKKVARVGGFRLPLLAFFVNAGLVFVIVFSFFPSVFREQTQRLVFPVAVAAPVQPGIKVTSGKPINISLPQLALSMGIIDGKYDSTNQSWTLSDDKAQYAVMTAPANDYEGNTFIYGHATKRVFSKLENFSRIGAEAIITTDNGYSFHYILKEVKDVKPNDVSLFAYSGKPILTVQTCSGSWYENRHLLVFDFVKVEKV